MSSFQERVVDEYSAANMDTSRDMTMQSSISVADSNETIPTNSKSYKEYGLGRWREYSVQKHGNSAKFQESPTGKKNIEAAVLSQYRSDALKLKQWADSVETAATQLLETLDSERRAAAQQKKKIASLEARLKAADPRSYNNYVMEFHRQATASESLGGVVSATGPRGGSRYTSPPQRQGQGQVTPSSPGSPGHRLVRTDHLSLAAGQSGGVYVGSQQGGGNSDHIVETPISPSSTTMSGIAATAPQVSAPAQSPSPNPTSPNAVADKKKSIFSWGSGGREASPPKPPMPPASKPEPQVSLLEQHRLQKELNKGTAELYSDSNDSPPTVPADVDQVHGQGSEQQQGRHRADSQESSMSAVTHTSGGTTASKHKLKPSVSGMLKFLHLKDRRNSPSPTNAADSPDTTPVDREPDSDLHNEAASVSLDMGSTEAALGQHGHSIGSLAVDLNGNIVTK